ncbi:MAG: ASCH domain-containing protein [Candidatus Limnocylindrales bacterium]
MPYPIVSGLRSIEFGSPGRLRSELTALVIARKKRATASLLSEYEDEGEAVEHVGERLAVLDNDARHVATIEVTRVETLRFDQVPDGFALAEGEGDLNAADFRAGHLRYWSGEGESVSDSTPVVTLYFDLVEDQHSGGGGGRL